MTKQALVALSSVAVFAVMCGCVSPTVGEQEAKISVFAHYVRSIAKERGVSLTDASRLLQDLGVTGFDASYDDPMLAELVATGLRPASLYCFLKFRVPDGGRGQAAKLLETAAVSGVARVMVIPDSFTRGGNEETEFGDVVAGLRRLVAEAAKKGVTVTVEDFGGDPDNPCNRMTYLKRFLDEIPGLRLALDSGNLYYAKRGEDILELMRYAEGRIAHVHLKDQLATDHRSQAVLGLGGVPNAEIVHHMAASGYSGWYTLENTVPEADTYIETVRQVAVLKAWLTGGCSYEEIARKLNVSRSRVNTLVESIYRKLKVHSKSRLGEFVF